MIDETTCTFEEKAAFLRTNLHILSGSVKAIDDDIEHTQRQKNMIHKLDACFKLVNELEDLFDEQFYPDQPQVLNIGEKQ